MAGGSFITGEELDWEGQRWTITRVLEDQRRTLEHTTTAERRVRTLDELLAALAAGELAFVGSGARSGASEGASDDNARILADYPKHIVAIAYKRLEWLMPVLASTGGKRTRDDIARRVAEIRATIPPEHVGTLMGKVSIAAMYEWLAAYEASGHDVRSLAPAKLGQRGAPEQPRLPQPVVTLMDGVIGELRDQEERSSIDEAHHILASRLKTENTVRPAAQQLPTPDRSTVARRILALDLVFWFKGTRGKLATERQRPQVATGERPTEVNEVWEIDETPADFIAVDDRDDLPLGRPYLMEARDKGTTLVAGYNLAFERGYQAVMGCLYHGILPKIGYKERYGLQHEWRLCGEPAELRTDNHRSFIGEALLLFCKQENIRLVQTARKQPRQKPIIERGLGTDATRFFHTMPGTTFHNPAERGDYDSVGNACIAVSEIDSALIRYYVDIDGYTKRGRKGFVPALELERRLAAGLPLRHPRSAARLSILLSRVAMRVIEPYGISLHGILYDGASSRGPLAALRARLGREQAVIRWHPGRLDRIHVLDPFTDEYIEVPAVDREYTSGLSLWKHKIIKRYAKVAEDEEDIVALGQAKEELRRQFREARERSKKRRRPTTRFNDARYSSAGMPTREREEWPDMVDEPESPPTTTAPEGPTPPAPRPATMRRRGKGRAAQGAATGDVTAAPDTTASDTTPTIPAVTPALKVVPLRPSGEREGWGISFDMEPSGTEGH